MESLKYKIENFLKILDGKNIDTDQFNFISNSIEKMENYIIYNEVLQNSELETKVMIQNDQRKKGIKEIRDFTKDAEKLIIIDPYFLAISNKNTETFIEDFKLSTHIHNLKYLNLIYDSNYGNTKSYITELKKLCASVHCRLALIPSNVFHDRIWIKNGNSGIIVGTSFGGIGKVRLSFILDLPTNDLLDILKYLQENGLV